MESYWNLVPHINEKYLSSCPRDWIPNACRMLLNLLGQGAPAGYDQQIAYDALAMLFIINDYKVREISITAIVFILLH